MTWRAKTCAAIGLCGLMAAGAAQAGPKIEFGEGQWASISGAMRTSFVTANQGAGSDFFLNSARLFLNGAISDIIGFQFDTEKNSDDQIVVLDAIAKFKFADEFNIWAGRMLPPSDRSNLDGPYYLGIWAFPSVQYYPGKIGRDDGVTIWGDVAGGVVSYSVGAFEGGRSNGEGTFQYPAGVKHKLMYAARLQVNLLDPEGGYYTQSDYYGAKDLLSIGGAIQYQADATGTAGNSGDYTAWNIDAIFTKKFDIGVPVLEGSYYHYSTDGFTAPFSGGLVGGKGWFVLGSFLIPQEVGIGKFQPVARYQKMDFNDASFGSDTKYWDLGLNYIIKDHNARIGLLYTIANPDGLAPTSKTFTIGLQVQL